MAEKEITLLKQQMEKLGEKKFDLEAWKNHTIILLERIFGEGNTRVKMIRDLHYDYSSWNLRDATGVGKTYDPVKIQAREILGAIISELELLGSPVKESKSAAMMLIEEELTGKQMKELESIIRSEDESKEEKIGKILLTLEKEKIASLLTRILLS